MSIFEYDEEKELALIRKDEYIAGIEEGKKAGIEEGKKTGIKDTMEKTALRMLSAGTYSLEEIADISGLPVKDIRQLQPR